jgi:hypothetical protein
MKMIPMKSFLALNKLVAIQIASEPKLKNQFSLNHHELLENGLLKK